MSDLFGLKLKLTDDGEEGYLLDGAVHKLATSIETIKVLQADGTLTEESLEIQRSVHGPVVAEHDWMPVAMKVSSTDRSGASEFQSDLLDLPRQAQDGSRNAVRRKETADKCFCVWNCLR